MSKTAIRNLLLLVLASLILVQAVVVDWHIDLPSVGVHAATTAHCSHDDAEQASSVRQNSTAVHHYHCCHSSANLVLQPHTSVAVLLAGLLLKLPTFQPEPYRDPHADQLIRPPIA